MKRKNKKVNWIEIAIDISIIIFVLFVLLEALGKWKAR